MERIVNLSFIKLDISSSDLLMSNEFIEELIRAETTINWLDGWQISEVKGERVNSKYFQCCLGQRTPEQAQMISLVV